MMSRPIKETPILYGKDSRVFSEKIRYNELHPAPKEEYDRIMETYNKMLTRTKPSDITEIPC